MRRSIPFANRYDKVELVRLSMAQTDALTILLTGRGESKFSSLIQKMVNSKGLKFDMICLKPAHGPGGEQVKETGQYKSILLLDILRTYKSVEEFKIYEDRIHHCTLFDDLLQEYTRILQAQGRPFKADVVEVVEEMVKSSRNSSKLANAVPEKS